MDLRFRQRYSVWITKKSKQKKWSQWADLVNLLLVLCTEHARNDILWWRSLTPRDLRPVTPSDSSPLCLEEDSARAPGKLRVDTSGTTIRVPTKSHLKYNGNDIEGRRFDDWNPTSVVDVSNVCWQLPVTRLSRLDGLSAKDDLEGPGNGSPG